MATLAGCVLHLLILILTNASVDSLIEKASRELLNI